MNYGTTHLVVLARQSSSRLPLKHLYPLVASFSALDVLMSRMEHVKGVDRLILAVGGKDHLYAEIGKAHGWDVFLAPDLEDEFVLKRVCRATATAKRVVVVNGDSPLMCPRLVEHVATLESDLVWCKGPSGMRVKALTRPLLEKWAGWVDAQQEHVLSGVVEPFGLGTVQCLDPWPLVEAKLSLDTIKDLWFLRKVVAEVGTDAEGDELIRAAISCDSDHWPGGAGPDA